MSLLAPTTADGEADADRITEDNGGEERDLERDY